MKAIHLIDFTKNAVMIAMHSAYQLDRSEWVSVEDKLPEDETTDVLFYNSGYKLCVIGRLYDRKLKIFWDTSADTHTQVTHWQPLPQPPNQK